MLLRIWSWLLAGCVLVTGCKSDDGDSNIPDGGSTGGSAANGSGGGSGTGGAGQGTGGTPSVGGKPKPEPIDCEGLGQSCTECGFPYVCFPEPDACLPVHGVVICGADISCPERAPICLTWASTSESDATCVNETEFDCVCATEKSRALIPRCASVGAGERVCIQGGGICDDVPCCDGSSCVAGSDGVSRCQQPCSDSPECATGCCHAPEGSQSKVCSPFFDCCARDDGSCEENYCCTGYTCAVFSEPAASLCKKDCTQNADCTTGCCAPLGGTDTRVCLDPIYCQ